MTLTRRLPPRTMTLKFDSWIGFDLLDGVQHRKSRKVYQLRDFGPLASTLTIVWTLFRVRRTRIMESFRIPVWLRIAIGSQRDILWKPKGKPIGFRWLSVFKWNSFDLRTVVWLQSEFRWVSEGFLISFRLLKTSPDSPNR